MNNEAESRSRVDPAEKRPAGDQGDTAVPAEGDIAQQPQTVEEDFRPEQ